MTVTPSRRRFRGSRALLLLLAVLVTAAPAAAVAQETPPDSVAAVAPDSAAAARVSPGGAFLRSLVLPGWGQSVLGAPGRGAVYFALEGTSLWMLLKTRSRLDDAERAQEFRRAQGLLAADQKSALVESREQQVEDWLVLSVFWLFFSAADAYVGAYLADFDENVSVGPAPDGALQVGGSIPVGPRP